MACGTFDEMGQKKKSVLFFNLLLHLATILNKKKNLTQGTKCETCSTLPAHQTLSQGRKSSHVVNLGAVNSQELSKEKLTRKARKCKRAPSSVLFRQSRSRSTNSSDGVA